MCKLSVCQTAGAQREIIVHVRNRIVDYFLQLYIL